MAITPLTSPFKSLTFAGQTSASFGVQILGAGTFNAPKRVVDMISIPGRNGAVAMDQGYYENIEVKYKANLMADSVEDFAEGIAAFRNFLCSRKGYCRLSDDYNPDEYRMAVYKRGLETDAKNLRMGEFEIVFDCKPQRWLTSGEEEITGSHQSYFITNPTQFDASPLLKVKGYGKLKINDYEIELTNEIVGEVTLRQQTTFAGMNQNLTFPDLMANGDTVTCQGLEVSFRVYPVSSLGYKRITVVNVTNSDYNFTTSWSGSGTSSLIMTTAIGPFSYIVGADDTKANTVTLTALVQGDGVQDKALTATADISIDCLSNRLYVSGSLSKTGEGQMYAGLTDSDRNSVAYAIGGYSTKSVLGDPTYVDCDLGECYKIENGKVVSLNGRIALGSDLPVFGKGVNTYHFDNTITELKIVPRWWQL